MARAEPGQVAKLGRLAKEQQIPVKHDVNDYCGRRCRKWGLVPWEGSGAEGLPR